MTSRDFAFWLQGYFEVAQMADPGSVPSLTVDQVSCIRRHLALVFKHEIDPSAGPPAHQQELDAIHGANHPVKIGGIDPISGMVYRC